MCGIVGYTGEKKALDVLIMGLKALEYRGYDSAGVCLLKDNKKEIIKSVGRVSKLEEKVKKEGKLLDATRGIAHTRWATNGVTNLVNSHPHEVGDVTLVHNGIIENSDLLKEELISKGYTFKSDTDSEVVAALLDNNLKSLNTIDAINNMTEILIGSYALVITIKNDDKLYALRKDSPLIIGKNNKESFAASDVTAISNYANSYVFLEEGEVAVLSKDNIDVYKDGKIIEKEYLKNDIARINTTKNGYSHYMLKEIMEEPVVLKNLIDKYISNPKDLDLSKYKEINIVACGSAMYAGMVSKYLIEEYANIKVEVEAASEYRYKKKIFNELEQTLVILISQSGETADTIAALRESNKLGLDTLGIVNNPNSTIARESKKVILTNGGVEIAVATTKAYILQVCVLSLMAITTGISKGYLNKNELLKFKEVPSLVKEVIEKTSSYKSLAEKIYDIASCFYIGRGIDYAISMEGSLKLKEVSYIHSEAYPAGELKHGTISLIEENMVVFTVITDGLLKEKTLSNLKECISRGARGVIITTKSLDTKDNNLKIVVPDSEKYLTTLIVVPALQLLAYYVALNKGCDIDKPRNLAKSVTVE